MGDEYNKKNLFEFLRDDLQLSPGWWWFVVAVLVVGVVL